MSSYESTPEEAYFDRNLMVQAFALLAKRLGYNVGIKNRDDAWPILYIDLPTVRFPGTFPAKRS